MSSGRCPLKCNGHHSLSRRQFIRCTAGFMAGSVFRQGNKALVKEPMATQNPIRPRGPASKCVPSIKAAFVRRKEDYGMLWPGAVYDGRDAMKMYSEKMTAAAHKLGAKFDLRGEPLYSLAEAEGWIAEAEAQKADGLVLVMMDRQRHAWPSAERVAQGHNSVDYLLATGHVLHNQHHEPGRGARLRRFIRRTISARPLTA